MEILYKDKNAVIIKKPVGMPSQSDESGDNDAMSLTSQALRASGESGALWLIHRLDRVVGGLMIFARNKKAAAELSALVADGGIGKEYIAVAEGELGSGIMQDYIFRDGATKKAYIAEKERGGVKFAELEYETVSTAQSTTRTYSLVKVELHTGRFHQIRAQFSSRGHALVGDKKYGSRDVMARHPALFAYKLDLTLFGKRIVCRAVPDCERYPWSMFCDKINSL
ncbi:MAG: RNA pseudouridine synthase [Clostridia bacterium]|nr:RNA pseudouridine synthase [Clostridia bacterium]